MNFLSNGIGDLLLTIGRLTLILSEEFAINDPYKIEQLKTAKLRSIPTDHDNGKLHAKVVIAKLKDGSHWILLGSANLTDPGMFSNQEACVELDSRNPEDRTAINSIHQWFEGIFKSSRGLNLRIAKEIFDQRSRYRLMPRPSIKSTEYWALKTTSGGPSGEEHWPLKRDFRYSSRQIDFSATTIRNFINLKNGTTILLCRGYTSNQRKPVHIYGFARVIGPFRSDRRNGSDWRFKHEAVIQEINLTVPRDIIASTLKKDTLRQTLHQLTEGGFTKLARELGVSIRV